MALKILSGNTLYGTARHGGTSDNGTVFQDFAGISHPAETHNLSLWFQCYFDVADQRHRFHVAIRHEPRRIGGLGHQFSGSGRRQRSEHSDQSHLWHTEVLQVKSVSLFGAFFIAQGSHSLVPTPDDFALTRPRPIVRRVVTGHKFAGSVPQPVCVPSPALNKRQFNPHQG